MEIKIIVLFVFLLLCSAFDWKNRAIPSWLCYSGIVFMVLLCLGKGDIKMSEAVKGAAVGAVLLGIGRLTKGQLGEGDGLVFMATGIGLGIWDNCILLLGASFLSFFWSLLLLVIGKRTLKTKFAFLPFVFAAFVLEFMIKI